MKNRILLYPVILIIILISVLYIASIQLTNSYVNSFTVNNRTYNFTGYALNLNEWEHGLMNSTINKSTFMLFEFNKSSIWNFWMFDTYTNLDIIWINASGNLSNDNYGTIVYLVKNASACINVDTCRIYTPKNLSDYVIETRYGFIQNNNIHIGQSIKFNVG